MLTIDLRQAATGDIPTCAQILHAWHEATEWMPKLHTLAETQSWMGYILFPTTQVTLAIEGEVPVGFIALEPKGQVVQLQIAQGHRGKGIGGRLLDHARMVSPKGLSLWCFEANSPALAFYARHGFRPLRRTTGQNEEGLPDVLLEWRPA